MSNTKNLKKEEEKPQKQRKVMFQNSIDYAKEEFEKLSFNLYKKFSKLAIYITITIVIVSIGIVVYAKR